MATYRIPRTALSVILCLLAASPPLATQKPDLPRPERRTTLRGAPDHFPLGGLGAEVDVLTPGEASEKGVKSRGCVILMRKIFPAEPAHQAGLKPGDLVVSLGRRPLPKGKEE